MQRTYRLINTRSYRNINVYNYSLYPTVNYTGFLEPGTNNVITGTNIRNITSVQISNSTFTNSNISYAVSNTTALKIFVPYELKIGNTYTLTITSTSGSITYSNATPAYNTGQQIFLNASANVWTPPIGVTNVSIVLVGAGGQGQVLSSGGGGAGGSLVYINNYPVSEGSNYYITAGSARDSIFANSPTIGSATIFLVASKGNTGASTSGGAPSSWSDSTGLAVGWGGGPGGSGINSAGGGGGGAAGYVGSGGAGAWSGRNIIGYNGSAATPGSGGGGGGGASSNGTATIYYGGGGGGVGLFGLGADGALGNSATFQAGIRQGGDGSGGYIGVAGLGPVNPLTSNPTYYTRGNRFGGGGGGGQLVSSDIAGGNGAVRIIWGNNRVFPNTNTGNF